MAEKQKNIKTNTIYKIDIS